MSAPKIEDLLRRMVDTPPEFLMASSVDVGAVASDVFLDLTGMALTIADVQPFRDRFEIDRLNLVLLTLWLVKGIDPPLIDRNKLGHLVLVDLSSRGSVQPDRYVTDAERREELVRFVLLHLEITPARESEAEAQDRFTAIDSAALVSYVDNAQRRAAVRRAMDRRAAQEAAAKVTRE